MPIPLKSRKAPRQVAEIENYIEYSFYSFHIGSLIAVKATFFRFGKQFETREG